MKTKNEINCPVGMSGLAVEPWSRGEIYAVCADWAQASCPVRVYGEDGWEFDPCGRQVADFRHSAREALEDIIRRAIVDSGDDPDEEDVDSILEDAVEIEHIPEHLLAMEEMLGRHGARFTGNNVRDEAGGWLDAGFDADSADEWCEVGFWDAETAASLRDAGVSPQQADEAAERLVEAAGDEVADEYTDGDPIYSACNGDTAVQEIIDAVARN